MFFNSMNLDTKLVVAILGQGLFRLGSVLFRFVFCLEPLNDVSLSFGPRSKKTMNYFGFNSVLEPEHRTRKFLFFWFISAQSQLAGLLFHKIRINILVLYNSVLEPEQRTRKFPILFISPQSQLAGLLFHKINYFGFI